MKAYDRLDFVHGMYHVIAWYLCAVDKFPLDAVLYRIMLYVSVSIDACATCDSYSTTVSL